MNGSDPTTIFNEKLAEARAILVEEEARLKAEDKARRAELRVKLAAIRKLLRSGREPKAA
jgi:hypothetical protein